MLPKENYLKTIAVVFTLAALLFFVYYQDQSYQKDINSTRQQLRLNILQGRLAYLDAAVTRATFSYILTGQAEWLQQHTELELEYKASISEIDKLTGTEFKVKQKLLEAESKMLGMEKMAIELARSNQQKKAWELLYSDEYAIQQKKHNQVLSKLLSGLEIKFNQFVVYHQNEAKKNSLIIGALILLIILGWYFFSLISRKWQNQILEANQKSTKEAISAEINIRKVNNQLHLLSEHLQEVREKERLSIANDINEELGQQLAVINIKISRIGKD